jgi:MscS family membrane protein
MFATATAFIHQHPVLQQLGIILLYLLVAKIADFVIDRLFRRLASKTSIPLDDAIISVIHAPFCWTIVFLGFLHALTLSHLSLPWAFAVPALIKSIIAAFWWVAGFRFINFIMAEPQMASILTRGKIGSDLFYMIKNLLLVAMVILGLLTLLLIWKVDLMPLFASAGIAGIAVALAAKDSLANFFGGISIFMDRTFKVGDYIILDSGERGEVVEVGIRSTRIKTRDDVLITIPNSIMANSKIINESAPIQRFRIRIPVGVAYGTDLEKVENILLQVANSHPQVVREPEPRARLRRFGSSSVDYELLIWVDDPRIKGRETHNLLKEVYKAFAGNSIVIPFPQLDVHLGGQDAEIRS